MSSQSELGSVDEEMDQIQNTCLAGNDIILCFDKSEITSGVQFCSSIYTIHSIIYLLLVRTYSFTKRIAQIDRMVDSLLIGWWFVPKAC